jgi:two-component system alkaline phosphatase synthesis response regulator PhoP
VAKKILVIEDNAEIVEMMVMMLEVSGYKAVSAYNGAEGLKKVKEEKPDLILLDVMMPGMSGFDVVKKLKSDKETAGIPVFIVSVKALDADIQFGKEKGANEYIVKPFEPQHLLELIEQYLSRGAKQ